MKNKWSSVSIIKSALLFALCFVPAFSLADSAASGTGCSEKSISYDLTKHGNNVIIMGGRLYQYLHNNVHRVAIVSRAGGDQSKRTFKNPPKQKYSHAGIAWKDSHGFWYFKHVLSTCGQNPGNPEFGNSKLLLEHPLMQFFNDNPHFYDIHIGSPSEDLQDKIVRVLEDENWLRSLYNPFYNIIGYPFKTVSQNSNGWVLAIIAAAQSGHRDLASVINHYRNQFNPSQVCTLLSKTVDFAKGNISTKEHPKRGLFGSGWGPGCYDFVSAASLYNYLGVTPEEICHPEGCNTPLTKLNKKDRPPSSHNHNIEDSRGGK